MPRRSAAIQSQPETGNAVSSAVGERRPDRATFRAGYSMDLSVIRLAGAYLAEPAIWARRRSSESG